MQDFVVEASWWRKQMGVPTPSSLQDVDRLFREVAKDSRLEGIFLELPALHSGWAECNALRELIKTLRAAGKRVVVYLPEGGGNREYFIACAGNDIWTSPQASVTVLGIGTELHYPKALLDRLGVEFQVFACGEFKTAAESMVRETMSEAQQEQMGALLQARHDQLMAAMADRFKGNMEHAHQVLVGAPWTGKRAEEQGVVDAVCYPDEAFSRLTGQDTPQWISAARYARWRGFRLVGPWRRKPHIAVIPVHGPIVLHSRTHSRTIAERAALVRALRKARNDPKAIGVLLHINSPGGSALASDLIHREVIKTREHKPVVAYFSDVAASGGYYIAAGADAIVAQPLSVTGSIGVIAAKPIVTRLFAKLGIRVHALRKAPHADMFSLSRVLDAEEQAIMERETEQFYQHFVHIVAEGRGWSSAQVEPLARGRVWSGIDAKHHGLVDHLGNVQLAAEEILARVKQAPRRTVQEIDFRLMPLKSARGFGFAESLFMRTTEGEDSLSQGLDFLNLCLGQEKVFYYAMGLPSAD